MRSPNSETLKTVARAATREQLVSFLHSCQEEPYEEEGRVWSKIFSKGGPLEWYNPPTGGANVHFVDAGTIEDWVRVAESRFFDEVLSKPDVTHVSADAKT